MTNIINGVLHIDDCNTIELTKTYGTPLYVYSENEIINRIKEMKRDFTDKYENTRIAYASKALSMLAIYKLINREGLSVDVVSGGELFIALESGVPAEHIEFNGNNKSDYEISIALDNNVGRFIVDGLKELDRIVALCKTKNKTANVLFRISPEIEANTHDYLTTGKKDAKFGIPIDEDILFPYVEKAINAPEINFLGLHFHAGSQIFDNSPFIQSTEVILSLAKEIKNRFNYDLTELNVGGGFGVRYTDEPIMPLSYYIDPVMRKIEAFYNQMNVKRPAVVIEPGRSVIAEAGYTLYTIGEIKNIEGVRKYVSIDGGMIDNIRPAMYGAKYTGIVANKADIAADDIVTIAGKACESGDVLIKDIKIPNSAEAGDIFAVYSTGAYGYVMASNYNSSLIPAVVLVKDGKSDIISKRQEYEQLIVNHIVPDRLK